MINVSSNELRTKMGLPRAPDPKLITTCDPLLKHLGLTTFPSTHERVRLALNGLNNFNVAYLLFGKTELPPTRLHVNAAFPLLVFLVLKMSCPFRYALSAHRYSDNWRVFRVQDRLHECRLQPHTIAFLTVSILILGSH